MILSDAINIFISLTLSTLVGAVCLRIAARRVVRCQLTFGDAGLTVLLANFATAALAVAIVVLLALLTDSEVVMVIAMVCILPISMLILAALISRRHRTTFDKACKMSLVIVGVMILINVIALAGSAIIARGFL